MRDERDGGDSPCWAHLFEDGPDRTTPDAVLAEPRCPDEAPPRLASVDLLRHAAAAVHGGAAWTHQGDDLSVNLLVFAAGAGVAAHVNADLDVLLVGVAGEGVVDVDGVAHHLAAGRALVIPKGARRAVRATSERFAYLSCHRRRAGLRPAPRA